METTEEKERQEIIAYGMQQLKYNGSCILFIGLMAALFGVFWQGIVFLVAFIPLRMYAGGYHADSRRRCFVVSFLAVGCVFLLMRFVCLPDVWAMILGAVSVAVIGMLAPVSNSVKVLERRERMVYRRRTRKIVAVEFVAFALLLWKCGYRVAEPVLLAMLLVVFVLLMGVVKYRT